MALNHLTGTVRAPSYFGPLNGEPENNIISGSFYGDGANLHNVVKIVANPVNDYLLTVGNDSYSIVGEPNLRFNGSRMYVNGAITASNLQLTNLASGDALNTSYLALDSNNNLVLTSSIIPDFTIAQGPVNSVQFHIGSGDLSGSSNLIYNPSTNTFYLTGTLVVSGTVEATTFDIISTTLTEINQFGSTAFGNTPDDTHNFTGSLSVYSGSLELFSVSSESKTLITNVGQVHKRSYITSSYSVEKSDYYLGIDGSVLTSSISLTLPDASTLQNGQTFVFKDEGGLAGTHTIEILAQVGQTIDNVNSFVLESPYSAFTLYCDGQSKFFIV